MSEPTPRQMDDAFRTASTGRRIEIGSGENAITTFHRPSLLDRTDQLNSAIDNVEKAYAELRARLEPVVLPSMPAPPTPEGMGRLASVSTDEPSWIAHYFDDVTARVHQIASSIAAFTDRVDL